MRAEGLKMFKVVDSSLLKEKKGLLLTKDAKKPLLLLCFISVSKLLPVAPIMYVCTCTYIHVHLYIQCMHIHALKPHDMIF